MADQAEELESIREFCASQKESWVIFLNSQQTPLTPTECRATTCFQKVRLAELEEDNSHLRPRPADPVVPVCMGSAYQVQGRQGTSLHHLPRDLVRGERRQRKMGRRRCSTGLWGAWAPLPEKEGEEEDPLGRFSELHRHNSLVRLHLRSCYSLEMMQGFGPPLLPPIESGFVFHPDTAQGDRGVWCSTKGTSSTTGAGEGSDRHWVRAALTPLSLVS